LSTAALSATWIRLGSSAPNPSYSGLRSLKSFSFVRGLPRTRPTRHALFLTVSPFPRCLPASQGGTPPSVRYRTRLHANFSPALPWSFLSCVRTAQTTNSGDPGVSRSVQFRFFRTKRPADDEVRRTFWDKELLSRRNFFGVFQPLRLNAEDCRLETAVVALKKSLLSNMAFLRG